MLTKIHDLVLIFLMMLITALTALFGSITGLFSHYVACVIFAKGMRLAYLVVRQVRQMQYEGIKQTIYELLESCESALEQHKAKRYLYKLRKRDVIDRGNHEEEQER